MTVRSDHIANKTSTASAAEIATAIQPGGTDPCLPGELVCQVEADGVSIHTLDANNTSQKINGLIKNENKGSFTVTNGGEGSSSIVLNTSAVTTARIADNSITSDEFSGVITVTKGGTEKTTAPEAINSLLPVQRNTLILVRGTGANNGTTWTDSSALNFPVTRTGDAKTVTTSFPPIGLDSSTYLDGIGDFLTVGSAGSLPVLTDGAFTIEAWINPSTHGSERRIFGFGTGAYGWTGTGGNLFEVFIRSSNGSFFVYTRRADEVGAELLSNYTLFVPLNTWSHFAVSFVSPVAGNPVYVALNGAVQTSTILNTVNSSLQGTRLDIGEMPGAGGYGFNRYFQGYIADVRLTKGAALYTSAYTVPTQPFPLPDGRPFALSTTGSAVNWSKSVDTLDRFDDVNVSNPLPQANQSLKWNSSTLDWAPSETISRVNIPSRITPGRNGEMGIDQDNIFVASNTDEWKRIQMNSW